MYGARLGPFLAHRFVETNAGARREMHVFADNAVLVEVDFVAVGGAEKSIAPIVIIRKNGAERLLLECLDVALHGANVILQCSRGASERVVYGEFQIGVARVLMRRARHGYFPATRKRHVNIDLVEAAFAMVTPRRTNGDMARGQPTEHRLKPRDMFRDHALKGLAGLCPVEIYPEWRLHWRLHNFAAIRHHFAPGKFDRYQFVHAILGYDTLEFKRVIALPYATDEELPPGVRHHLPRTAQDIYREAFNHAWYTYTGDPRHEEIAHRVAWAAVKRSYQKAGDTWVPVHEQRAH